MILPIIMATSAYAHQRHEHTFPMADLDPQRNAHVVSEVDVQDMIDHKKNGEGLENEYSSLGQVKPHSVADHTYETLPKLNPPELAPTQDTNILPQLMPTNLVVRAGFQAQCSFEAVKDPNSSRWPSSRTWSLAHLLYLWTTGALAQTTKVSFFMCIHIMYSYYIFISVFIFR